MYRPRVLNRLPLCRPWWKVLGRRLTVENAVRWFSDSSLRMREMTVCFSHSFTRLSESLLKRFTSHSSQRVGRFGAAARGPPADLLSNTGFTGAAWFRRTKKRLNRKLLALKDLLELLLCCGCDCFFSFFDYLSLSLLFLTMKHHKKYSKNTHFQHIILIFICKTATNKVDLYS